VFRDGHQRFNRRIKLFSTLPAIIQLPAVLRSDWPFNIVFLGEFSLSEILEDQIGRLIHRLSSLLINIFPQITQIIADFKNYKQTVYVEGIVSQNLL
jgi:hypothetical protein